MLFSRSRLVGPLILSLALSLGACASNQASHSAKGGAVGAGAYKVGKPYQIGGVWYYPKVDYAYRERGIASWYGPGFHGKPTANGESFDENDLTAAHRTLPLPSMVRVTNLENGRSIAVRINDRGPFAHGRIIDVSRRAAQLLGFEQRGTAKVEVTILEDESRQLAAASGAGFVESAQVTGSAPTAPGDSAVPLVSVATAALPPIGSSVSAVSVTPSPGAVPQARQVYLPSPDGSVTTRPIADTSIYIQAGSFVNSTNAAQLSARLSRLGRAEVVQAEIGTQRFYRVRLGPLTDVAAADQLLTRIIDSGHKDARIVVD